MSENTSTRQDYGPLLTYEVIWKSGHVETLQGHQVIIERHGSSLLEAFAGSPARGPARVLIHGEFDGRWRLVLMALYDEIATIRDVTDREVLRDGTS